MTGLESQPTPAFDVASFLQTLTQLPGVYKMLDAQNEVIYVGKAKNLKKRVSSYFLNRGDVAPKQQAMVARVQRIEISVTHSEGEALLLESQLIKRLRPRYNITLRDDKSYPYIYVSTQHPFPRVSFYRGARKKAGRLFGPFPSASAVRESLKLLQKTFPVRQCQDSYYSNRSRPCLEYQIERCTAPCVDLISQEDYAVDVNHTVMFLEGRSNDLIGDLALRMEQAAHELEFEKAAQYRDQIGNLRTLLDQQSVSGEKGDLDILACAIKGTLACVQMLFIRSGLQIGDHSFYPEIHQEFEPSSILEAFIPQYYLNHEAPGSLLLSHNIRDRELLQEVLSAQAGHSVKITSNPRGERLKRVQLALTNAENALMARFAGRQNTMDRLFNLGEVLALPAPPARLECFDISHTQGEKTVASCVVFDMQGPVKSAYRRFNIEGITGGDDYAALSQAVKRRYQRIASGEYPAPDILLIDGGKAQVAAVTEVINTLNINNLYILGVAKGPDRKPGMEMLFPSGQNQPILLPPHAPALLLIQQIRDEAHRFAITGHRQRRARARKQSTLESIPGLGPKRRQQLLRQFGGLREISRASVDTLSHIDGISRELAKRIYETLHEQDPPI
ncbi:excinuclease ABC subunit UvrC [Candidatus Methylospira mobilis]|uniref:UvrABC system protein C n=1 Tax=Candidatus Methylospira mobilis TaxID=1808979 RepID=A0A5Q0BM64_9GAMM|nr:excinuclease ABC subunit UvrC [Candidatus Methylospira mobilis]QFY43197.1 excinuclease ABC subunit UvrC [Candidatus Methylospira mobilis]WNV03597.1 excinuclease ABC subunit UvrC [Candidatus Methylospira mobilis]